jgi:hypothetical protein
VAVMEVCGFNGWLIKRLTQWGCRRVCVIKAPDRVRQKTDRRGAVTMTGAVTPSMRSRFLSAMRRT